MKFRSLLAAAAAFTLTTAPVLAQSATADFGRAVAPASESSLEGDSTILLILAVIAAGLGIYLLADNDDDKPASP